MQNLKSAYPSVGQSWGIAGIAVLSMLVFTPLNSLLQDSIGKEGAMFVYYCLSMGAPLLFAHQLRKKENGESRFNLKADRPLIFLLLIVGMIGLQVGLTLPLSNLIPIPDSFKEIFQELAKNTGLFGFLTIVIAAPILEEFIFRGIILDGLLRRMGATKAILISSMLFGLVHLNPWQFISAMIIGSFSGWVYYKTKNLSLCVFIHFTNNLTPFLLMMLYPETDWIDLSLTEFYGGQIPMAIFTAGGIILAGLSIFLLRKELRTQNYNVEN